MATTYKKSLKTLTIKTAGGQAITAADTADNQAGSNALASFLDYKTMVITGENGAVTYVPFHAVDSVAVTIAQSDDITRKDPVCEE